MKRKLLALLLSGMVLMLTMGAGVEKHTSASEPAFTAPTSVSEALDASVLINGQPAPRAISKYIEAGVSYVSLADMARALDSSAKVTWNEKEKTMVVSTSALKLTAVCEHSFIEANGRYLYVPNRVQVLDDGRVIIPLKVVAKAFDASVCWEEATQTIHITRGSGAIKPGNQFYKEDAVFWLSRVIYAESGGEVMKGMIAVGNVVMNRVSSKNFPNTIYGVISQKNQFSTFKDGKLARCTPTERSVIAAKIVLDGGVVDEVKNAYFFDAFLDSSWAARNKDVVATIGGHRFYG